MLPGVSMNDPEEIEVTQFFFRGDQPFLEGHGDSRYVLDLRRFGLEALFGFGHFSGSRRIVGVNLGFLVVLGLFSGLVAV